MEYPIYDSSAVTAEMDYATYRSLTDKLLSENKTSGNNHSSFMIDYTKMNVQRMNRLDKTVVLNEDLLNSLKELSVSYIFLVLTESWCGDASQIVPVFNKIAEASEGKIELRLIWRDENLELMDRYLTNGGRAIPKLIILEKTTLSEIGQWGPRPAVLQELYGNWKNEGLEMMQISEKIHSWYAKDKTAAIQQELKQLIAGL